MKPQIRTSLLLLFAVFASTAPAQAADHQMHVSEVHPSPANAALGFVELLDASAETFPATSYTLASLDGSGAVIGQQAFTPPYGFARSAEPFLVGAAGVQPRDATLTISLAGARKVCFYRGAGTSDPIHCLVLGDVPDGQSAQLTSTDNVVLACPTPDAANRQAPGTCATPGLPTDLRSPDQALTAKKRQRIGRLAVSVVVDEASTLTAAGSIQLGRRRLAFKKVTRSTPAGAKTTIRLKLSIKDARLARRALRRGRRLKAKVRIVARDRANNTSLAKRTVNLKL